MIITSKQSISLVYRLLEFIKKNTDKAHPASQDALRKIAGKELSDKLMGDKGTFSRRLTELADAYNRDVNGNVLLKEKWKIVYPGFNKPEGSKSRNGKIYYAHAVSEFEMDFLIDKIRSSNCLTQNEKDSLEERLISALCSKYYKPLDKGKNALVRFIGDTDETDESTADKEKVAKKLKIIREHILSKHMLELSIRDMKKSIKVSPYRVLYDGKEFWLIGNWHERPQHDVKWNSYTDALTSINVSFIDKLQTAHTPDEKFIYWAITKELLPDQSYTRVSNANRETKARYNKWINADLKKLDSLTALKLKHMMDLEL